MKDEDLAILITNNIKNEILSSGKSKSRIAEELGISKPTLSQYLSGRVLPSLTTFKKLCEVIDCSADEVLNLSRREI